MLLFMISFSYGSGINWLDFNEGMRRAEKEKKLILLDIYAQWCHWCNVMENTTYSDKEVVHIVNRYYIPVRVDAEKYPEINRKYNQGGLPSTVVLDWKGNVLWGGIYVPPDQMKGILNRFKSMNEDQIRRIVLKNREKKIKKLKRLERRLKEKSINKGSIDKIFRYIKFKFDYEYGGFSGAPKFPVRELPYFLALRYLTGDKTAKGMLKKTIEGYMKLFDPVEGGIYRYAVTEYWTEPHYEKLLKDQAEVSILLFNIYSLFGDGRYLEYAERILSFCKNKLYDKETGLFFNSQGADIVDDEGRLLVPGEDFFIYGKEKREEIVRKIGYGPNIERDIYFPVNALISNALLHSYGYTGNVEDLSLGLDVLERILKEGFTENGVRYSPDRSSFLLSTQVYTVEALLTAYQLTSEKRYLELSEKITGIVTDRYYSKKLGIYTDLKETGFNINRISFIDDIITLNYRFARVLLKLNLFTGSRIYLEKSRDILKRFPDRYGSVSGLAYYLYLYPPLAVHIIGMKEERNEYIRKAFKVFPYYVYPHFIENSDLNFIKKLGYEPQKITSAFVCNCCVCFKKIQDKRDIKDQILSIFSQYIPLEE
ncbi:conserved hypothetical protein [Persephonella marina EX-H1]|uniref:Spermatogenesis-associated protein 20-like TRX domain-containing protein n=2 Tax=Hydrogenothermaceae TaxID=224027 RepID=C0QSP3_PERMH|nr:conserved hypothetical protein [Persephonella marina EX-H1]